MKKMKKLLALVCAMLMLVSVIAGCSAKKEPAADASATPTLDAIRERGELIDATYGRRTRAVIIMDSGHVILSALQPETVSARMIGRSEEPSAGERGEE